MFSARGKICGKLGVWHAGCSAGVWPLRGVLQLGAALLKRPGSNNLEREVVRMTSLQPLREKLARAQTAFFEAADRCLEIWGQLPRGAVTVERRSLVATWWSWNPALSRMATTVDTKARYPRCPSPRACTGRCGCGGRVIRANHLLPAGRKPSGEKRPCLRDGAEWRERTDAFIWKTKRRDLRPTVWRNAGLLGM